MANRYIPKRPPAYPRIPPSYPKRPRNYLGVNPIRKRPRNYPLIILSGIFILIVVLILGYFLLPPFNIGTGEREDIEDSNINIETDVGVTYSCGDSDCFEEKFAECAPANITAAVFETLSYYYEILGPKDGLCEVKSKYPTNPNPEWVDKEMICLYDNSKPFNEASMEITNSFNTDQHLGDCQGELYLLMTTI